MNVRYTPAAREDLRELHDYIAKELHNPDAAARIVSGILKQCGGLKEMPLAGGSLAAKTGRETDLRYRICGKHIVFYRVQGEMISVIRILDGRRNYLEELF